MQFKVYVEIMTNADGKRAGVPKDGENKIVDEK